MAEEKSLWKRQRLIVLLFKQVFYYLNKFRNERRTKEQNFVSYKVHVMTPAIKPSSKLANNASSFTAFTARGIFSIYFSMATILISLDNAPLITSHISIVFFSCYQKANMWLSFRDKVHVCARLNSKHSQRNSQFSLGFFGVVSCGEFKNFRLTNTGCSKLNPQKNLSFLCFLMFTNQLT